MAKRNNRIDTEVIALAVVKSFLICFYKEILFGIAFSQEMCYTDRARRKL